MTVKLDERYKIGKDNIQLPAFEDIEYEVFFNLCNADEEMPETLQNAHDNYEKCKNQIEKKSRSIIDIKSE